MEIKESKSNHLPKKIEKKKASTTAKTTSEGNDHENIEKCKDNFEDIDMTEVEIIVDDGWTWI